LHNQGNFVSNYIIMKSILTSILFLSITLMVFPSDGNKNLSSAAGMTIDVKGSVQDSFTGESLAGVLVRLENTGYTVYTDLNGNFEFKKVTPGVYKITVEYISYKSFSKEYELNNEKTRLCINLENKN